MTSAFNKDKRLPPGDYKKANITRQLPSSWTVLHSWRHQKLRVTDLSRSLLLLFTHPFKGLKWAYLFFWIAREYILLGNMCFISICRDSLWVAIYLLSEIRETNMLPYFSLSGCCLHVCYWSNDRAKINKRERERPSARRQLPKHTCLCPLWCRLLHLICLFCTYFLLFLAINIPIFVILH